MLDWERDRFLRELDVAQTIDDVKSVLAALIKSLPTETIVEKHKREKGWEPYDPKKDPVVRRLEKRIDDLLKRL
jgi:hypothetical protein